MNNNKGKAEKPVLMSQLLNLLAKCEETTGQKRVFNRIKALVMAELFTFGRHTVTQLLLTLGLTDEDWSGWYRLFSEGRYKEEEVAKVMAGEMIEEVKAEEPMVVGVDGFHVARSSQKMPGTGWMRGLQTAKFKPGIQRGQRFVELSWLTPRERGYARAIPMRCISAFTQKSIPSAQAARTEVEAGIECLKWTREQMDEKGREKQQLLTLNDGRYDTLNFWSQLPERTIGVVRTARNRALYHLPPEAAHGNTKYGEKAPAPHAWLKKRKGFSFQEVLVRGNTRRMRYRVEGPFVRDGLPDIPLFLIVIGGGKRPPGSRRKQYKPCYFLVSASCVDGVWQLPLPLPDILAWLWQRWELEVAHRQMKSGLGLGEKQCWHSLATITSVQWAVWIYALMMLSGYRAWGNDVANKPPGLWRTCPGRWSFNTLWRQIRVEMWHFSDFRATWTWSRANWSVNEPLWNNLFNSILASARI